MRVIAPLNFVRAKKIEVWATINVPIRTAHRKNLPAMLSTGIVSWNRKGKAARPARDGFCVKHSAIHAPATAVIQNRGNGLLAPMNRTTATPQAVEAIAIGSSKIQ